MCYKTHIEAFISHILFIITIQTPFIFGVEAILNVDTRARKEMSKREPRYLYLLLIVLFRLEQDIVK